MQFIKMSISVLECYKLVLPLKNPCKQWDKVIVSNILVVFVILHNMMIENEKTSNLEPCFDEGRIQLWHGLSFAKTKLKKNKLNVEINITICIMILLKTCGICKATTKDNE